MPSERDKASEKRRLPWWRQFTISNLILIIALAAVSLGWLRDLRRLSGQLDTADSHNDSLRRQMRELRASIRGYEKWAERIENEEWARRKAARDGRDDP